MSSGFFAHRWTSTPVAFWVGELPFVRSKSRDAELLEYTAGFVRWPYGDIKTAVPDLTRIEVLSD